MQREPRKEHNKTKKQIAKLRIERKPNEKF